MVKQHQSPLHKLMYNYNIRPNHVECIEPAPCNPALTHKQPFRVSIPADKDASVKEDKQAREWVRVYTDGLAQDSKVGAAAILIRNGEPDRTLHLHLGPDTQHTVYKAELIGILLGLHLIKTDKKGRMSYSMRVDNRAALSTLRAVKSSPGQYITNAILNMAYQTRKTRNSENYSLRFRWTAGHVGIPGNEKADVKAKAAAEGKTLIKKDLPPLLCKKLQHNKSALRQHRHRMLKKCWLQEWRVSPQYNQTKTLDSSLLSNKFIKLISDDRLSRMDASRICQLRTGHVPLNVYLHRIRKAEGPCCPPCRHPKENVKHYIMDCPSYAHEHWALYKNSKKKNLNLADLLNDKNMAVLVANFIQATGQFGRDAEGQMWEENCVRQGRQAGDSREQARGVGEN